MKWWICFTKTSDRLLPEKGIVMDTLFSIQKVIKRYAHFTLDIDSLALSANSIMGLIGSNGAGKTTLIKSLLGLLFVDAGSIDVLDKSIAQDGKHFDLPIPLKEHIGVVFDSCSFPPSMTVGEIALLGASAYTHWDAEFFASLCEQFELSGANKKIQELSRGMGMKLSLAFALAHHPQLLILDEATAGLDPMVREEVLQLLREFVAIDSNGVLLASHITSDLEHIADEIVCLDKGTILFAVPKEDITDTAGVAHMTQAEYETFLHSDYVMERVNEPSASKPNAEKTTSGIYVLQQPYALDVVIPDRYEFSQVFPSIPVERVSIETYMTHVLKGLAL